MHKVSFIHTPPRPPSLPQANSLVTLRLSLKVLRVFHFCRNSTLATRTEAITKKKKIKKKRGKEWGRERERGASKVLQPHKCDKIYVWFSGCLLVSLKVASLPLLFPPLSSSTSHLQLQRTKVNNWNILSNTFPVQQKRKKKKREGAEHPVNSGPLSRSSFGLFHEFWCANKMANPSQTWQRCRLKTELTYPSRAKRCLKPQTNRLRGLHK